MAVLDRVDLADLALALEDHSAGHSWWLDPETGQVSPVFGDSLVPEHEPSVPGAIKIDPLPTPVGYGDMEEFVSQVRDPRVRDQLQRAISGRGAFRRFKDALLDHPGLRRAWFAFHDARGERRAVEWLIERRLVDPQRAEQELELRPEPALAELPGILDAQGVALQVARDLRRLYRHRLKGIVLTGPWASGGVHPEAELALVVILGGAVNRWEEKRRMDRVAWRHSVRHDTVITALPITEEDYELPVAPVFAGALEGGVRIE
jgi:hypothetical protein